MKKIFHIKIIWAIVYIVFFFHPSKNKFEFNNNSSNCILEFVLIIKLYLILNVLFQGKNADDEKHGFQVNI